MLVAITHCWYRCDVWVGGASTLNFGQSLCCHDGLRCGFESRIVSRGINRTHVLTKVNIRLRHSWFHLSSSLTTTRFICACLAVHHFALQELKIFAKYFDGEPIEINGLTACLVNTMRLLFDLFVLKDNILLDGQHFFTEALYSNKFVIGFRDLYLVKDLQNLFILILDINQTQLLFLVLTDEANKLATLLDFIERFDKLVRKVFYPLNVFFLHFN